MDTIKIQVEVGFSEAAETFLKSIFGNINRPGAPKTEAPRTEVVVREIEHPEPIQPEAPATQDEPMDDPALRKVVTAAAKRAGRDVVAAHLKTYDWYRTASVDCPMDRRAELIANLKAL